jgi:hypothetical protein
MFATSVKTTDKTTETTSHCTGSPSSSHLS